MVSVRFGIPWSHKLSLKEAESLYHPFEAVDGTCDVLKTVLVDNLAAGPNAVRKTRRKRLEYWNERKATLVKWIPNMTWAPPKSP